jgi:hypothetical protein
MPLYLLLGDASDPCCLGVQRLLTARDLPTRIIQNPFENPSSLTWRLRSGSCTSEIRLDSESEVADPVSGVLVRNAGRVDPQGWKAADFSYMCAETSAALLAWLHSLPCAVVNRYPSLLWFQPRVPLLFWHGELQKHGLPIPDVVVTNAPQSALAYRERLAREGVAGVIYGPLTSEAQYLVSRHEEWQGLTSMQRYAPVCLSAPHGPTQLACVVGDEIVWEHRRTRQAAAVEPGMRRFTASQGLVFAEFAVSSTRRRTVVVGFDACPRIERFGAQARERILNALTKLLTGEPA